LPALTKAEAAPLATRRAPTTMEDCNLRRTLSAAWSSIVTVSGARSMVRPSGTVSPDKRDSRRGRSPTRQTGMPSSRAARRPPCTISSGARSPPMASRAMGFCPRAVMDSGLLLVLLLGDDLAPVVVAALRAHPVRQLGRHALRAGRIPRCGQHPRGAPLAGPSLGMAPLGIGQ